jgi:hypothetical protein
MKPDMVEGPEAFKRFKGLVKTVLQVPHEEIQKRVAKEREQALKNPNRPGPKPKRRRSRASGVASKRG